MSGAGRAVEFQQLLHAADAALHEAKNAGRNRVVFSAGTEHELAVVTA